MVRKIQKLSYHGNVKAINKILEYKESPDPFVRDEIIIGLLNIGTKEVVPELGLFLRDEDSNVACRAHRALTQLWFTLYN